MDGLKGRMAHMDSHIHDDAFHRPMDGNADNAARAPNEDTL